MAGIFLFHVMDRRGPGVPAWHLGILPVKPIQSTPAQSVSQSVSQSNPVQIMRPFLIPGTVSFAPDTGTPAFETVTVQEIDARFV